MTVSDGVSPSPKGRGGGAGSPPAISAPCKSAVDRRINLAGRDYRKLIDDRKQDAAFDKTQSLI